MSCSVYSPQSIPALLAGAEPSVIEEQLVGLEERLAHRRQFDIGFPGTSDVHHEGLSELLTSFLLNNIGDPFEDGTVTHHSKAFERQVLEAFAWVFRAPAQQWWGYVTTGSSEGTLHALRTARALYPHGIVLHSAAAHYSVAKAADLLSLTRSVVATDERGEMDYADLATKLAKHPGRTPVIVATIGTTMTEAIDDVHRITAICNQAGIQERFIHADAALSGVPLATMAPNQRPGFDLTDGADSIVCSGHKFLSTLMPCAVLIMKTRSMPGQDRVVDYLGGHDTTITGSRNGHLPLLLWSVIARFGLTGLRERAENARQIAEYACQRLRDIGWDAWRHPHAFTVVLRTPPLHITARWPLPSSNGWSHLITMPGISRQHVDRFVRCLATAHPGNREETVIAPRRSAVNAIPRWQ